MKAESQRASKRKTSPIVNGRVGLLDNESGEVIDGGNLIYVPRKVRIKGFFMGMQDGFEYLAKAKLKGEAMSVLMLLMSRMDYGNEIRLTQKEIGETLSMKKQNVSRAMKALREVGVLDPDEPHLVHLNASIGWKGKVQNMRKREKELARKKRDMGSEMPSPVSSGQADLVVSGVTH
jgi:hypothetical protein